MADLAKLRHCNSYKVKASWSLSHRFKLSWRSASPAISVNLPWRSANLSKAQQIHIEGQQPYFEICEILKKTSDQQSSDQTLDISSECHLSWVSSSKVQLWRPLIKYSLLGGEFWVKDICPRDCPICDWDLVKFWSELVIQISWLSQALGGCTCN